MSTAPTTEPKIQVYPPREYQHGLTVFLVAVAMLLLVSGLVGWQGVLPLHHAVVSFFGSDTPTASSPIVQLPGWVVVWSDRLLNGALILGVVVFGIFIAMVLCRRFSRRGVRRGTRAQLRAQRLAREAARQPVSAEASTAILQLRPSRAASLRPAPTLAPRYIDGPPERKLRLTDSGLHFLRGLQAEATHAARRN